jgi:hypothetical protein
MRRELPDHGAREGPDNQPRQSGEQSGQRPNRRTRHGSPRRAELFQSDRHHGHVDQIRGHHHDADHKQCERADARKPLGPCG